MTLPPWAAAVLLAFMLAQLAAVLWAFVKWQGAVNERHSDFKILDLKVTQILEVLNRNNLDVMRQQVIALEAASARHTEGHKANRLRIEQVQETVNRALDVVTRVRESQAEHSSDRTNPRFNPPPGDGR